MAGVVFLSNLNVFTQPCGTSQQWFYEENNKPVTTTPPPTYIWGVGGSKNTSIKITFTLHHSGLKMVQNMPHA
jgi:hypothetical protein